MQVTATTATTNTDTTVRSQDLGTKDVFLKLLVAQMRHQDPLKPQDATEMSAQLARFNMVEQQIETNKRLDTMLANAGSNTAQAAATYLGHQAVVNSNQLHFDGSAPRTISVNLDKNAAQAYVAVLDANGQVVRTLNTGPMAAGSNELIWNGLTDSGGTTAAGDYHIQVTAKDADGQPLTASTQTLGLVEAVRLTPAGAELVVGGSSVAMAAIAEIRK